CSTTTLGIFDHTKGGHLVLWDARMIIEFLANLTIFIPSTTSHNSPLQCQGSEG
ncbi:hypothetical protein BDN71DRAFT_1386783, partial [Pleurotus eryngii]